jgi:hypothetical protein
MPNRFLHVIRSRLNLSSGLNRAGCADFVGVPSGASFCNIGRAAWELEHKTGAGKASSMSELNTQGTTPSKRMRMLQILQLMA